jgi:hypothetical protein
MTYVDSKTDSGHAFEKIGFKFTGMVGSNKKYVLNLYRFDEGT